MLVGTRLDICRYFLSLSLLSLELSIGKSLSISDRTKNLVTQKREKSERESKNNKSTKTAIEVGDREGMRKPKGREKQRVDRKREERGGYRQKVKLEGCKGSGFC